MSHSMYVEVQMAAGWVGDIADISGPCWRSVLGASMFQVVIILGSENTLT